MKRIVVILILLFSINRVSAGNEITVNFNSVALNTALLQVSSEWNLSLSFNDKELSGYTITISGSFRSPEDLLRRMINNLPLDFKKISDVWVITSKQKVISEDFISEPGVKSAVFRGVIMDVSNGERLSYALITYGQKRFYSDRNGIFSFSVPSETEILTENVSVTYLGYNAVNVSLETNTLNRIFLSPASYDLGKVVVRHYLTGRLLQSGDMPSSVRINHSVSKYLPGSGDNSVFNMLKLMPGVRASGEPSFLSVWGSGEGESFVKMDGYRLYAMNNFNEHISSVNPFMVKEMRLIKGAYPSNFGSAVGSVAEVIGIDGNTDRATFKANINNLTANVFASLPTGPRSVVMGSFRQTYYNLYDVNKLNPFGKSSRSNGNNSPRNILITPDYMFRDLNIRFRGSFGHDNSVSAAVYWAMDDFKYNFESGDLLYNANESNEQRALSVNLNTKTFIPGRSDISISYSSNDMISDNIRRVRGHNIVSYKTDNIIGETAFELNHNAEIFKSNFIDAGISVKYIFDSFSGDNSSDWIYSAFANDKTVFNNIETNIGFRYDYYAGKGYFQPRISASLKIGSSIKLNGAYGKYTQFSGKIPYIDFDGNFSYLWKLFNGITIPIIKSNHYTGGISYSNKGWLFNAEVFRKVNSGTLKFFKSGNNVRILESDNVINGLDLLLNKEFRGSWIFVSTELSNVSERLKDAENSTDDYSPIEIKSGTLINLNPFYISLSHIYGLGYKSQYGSISNLIDVNTRYSRTDIALYYRFSKRRFVMNAGISILNLFNNTNYKYIDVIPSVQGGQSGYLNTYSEAVPFTPLLSLEINL